MRFGDSRVQALAGALCVTVGAVTGITNRSLRALMTGLLGIPYGITQASYDLARLRQNGLLTRRPHTNTYDLTAADSGSPSFTPRSTTESSPRSSPPTNPKHRPTSGTRYAPSTTTSTTTSPTHASRRSLKLDTDAKTLATKGHYAASGTSPGSGGPSGSFTSRGRGGY